MAERAAQGQIDELNQLIENIETCMMTTRRLDGRLVSRPMATQKRHAIADLWFVTDIESDKLDELEHDPQVNLAYFDNSSREWVSVSGSAQISRDRGQIRSVYQPDWKIWFGREDEVRDGGPDDPRLALILVSADSVVYLKQDKPKPMVLFEVARAMVTGEQAELGTVRHVDMHPHQPRAT